MGGDDTAQIYFMRQVLALMDGNPKVERCAHSSAACYTCEWRFRACPSGREHDRLLCFNNCWQATASSWWSLLLCSRGACCRYAWFAPDVSAPIFNWVGAAASLLSSSAPTDVGQVRWLTRRICVCSRLFTTCSLAVAGSAVQPALERGVARASWADLPT